MYTYIHISQVYNVDNTPYQGVTQKFWKHDVLNISWSLLSQLTKRGLKAVTYLPAYQSFMPASLLPAYLPTYLRTSLPRIYNT